MTDTIQTHPKYTMRIWGSFEQPSTVVQSITVWNHALTGEELGEFIGNIHKKYKPSKIIIVDDPQNKAGT